MAAAGTVAVILPGAFYTLARNARRRRSRLLRQHGVPMAVATDCNPGSSPMTSLLLAMNMACTLFRLTPEEALAGVTRPCRPRAGPGRSGRDRRRPCAPIWRSGTSDHPAELAYRIGFNPLHRRIFGGALPPDPDPRHHDRWPQLERIWPRRRCPSALDRAARPGVERAAAAIAAAAAGDAPVYGVNTGFGKLASVRIAPEDTATLQRNLILSHCCGVGDADARAPMPG